MADIEISDEAIAAQRAFDAADAEVRRLVDRLPSGVAVAAGEAEISDEERAEVQQARDARLEALHVLRAGRAKIGGDPVKVEQAVQKVARGGDSQDAS
ncbi:hypothetical protein [Nonomuraea sp. NPDC050643]|uniref:hypothetical protein n=1 Tax=Nonomuraea sp. NPDC050643 TaxID=3155660 RepID=UPI0033D579A5